MILDKKAKHEYKFKYVHAQMYKKQKKRTKKSIMISKYFTDNTSGLQRFDTINYNNIKYFRQ